MAKKKKKDDDFDSADDLEAAADDQTEPADDEPAEPADADDTSEPTEPGEPVEELEPEPKPAVSTPTIVLGVLNVLAACAFFYFLIADLERRQTWSYSVFQHDLALDGLPLDSEGAIQSASRAIRPVQNLSGEAVAKAHQSRKPGVTVTEPFLAVNEQLPNRIRPDQITPEILTDLFGKDFGPPVKSLEEEIERLSKDNKLYNDLAQAAQEAALSEKTPADQKKKLEKVLLSMACNVQQVQAIDKKIGSLKPAEYVGELEKAYLRRMLVDILIPIEYFRPGDVESKFTEKLGDLAGLKNDEIAEQLRLRLLNAVAKEFDGQVHLGKDWSIIERGTIERCAAISFVLFTIAQAKKPDGTEIYKNSPLRAQAIVGLHEFSLAARAYTNTLLQWQKRVLDLIVGDRQGDVVEIKGEFVRTPGFVDLHPNLIDKMRVLQREIVRSQTRLDSVKVERDKYQKNLEEREKHLIKITAQLVQERDRTFKMMSELNLQQDSFFEALKYLTDAQDRNVEILREIQLLGRKRPTN